MTHVMSSIIMSRAGFVAPLHWTRFYLLLVRTFERYTCLPLLRQHTPEPSLALRSAHRRPLSVV